MNSNDEIVEKLSKSIRLDNFIELAYGLVDKMMLSDNQFMFVELILKLMKNNPDMHLADMYYILIL